MKTKILFLLLIVSAKILTHANTYHVDTSGTDLNDGSILNPFATIQKGINSANMSDTVLVYPGTYIENINFNGKNIVVCSKYISTQDKAYISSTIIDGNKSGAVVRFNNNETSDAKLIGFTLTNGYGDEGGGIACSNASPRLSNLIVKNNEAFMSGGGINLMTSNSYLSEITVKNNKGADGGGGIYIWNDANVKLENILVFGNSTQMGGGGIATYSSEVDIKNATIVSNLASGGRQGGGIHIRGGNNVTKGLKNCIVWGNSPNNIVVETGLPVEYSNIEGGYSGEGNIDSNPYFRNIEMGDWNLGQYSPCIGSGTSTDAPIIDIENNTRPTPAGTNPDMGAFEHELGCPKIKFNTNICALDTLLVEYNGKGDDGITLEWEFEDATFVDTTIIKYPKVIWNKGGNKKIKLTVKESGLIINEQIDSTLVFDIPTPEFVLSTNKLCGADTVLVSYAGTGTGNGTYNWSFDEGTILSGSGQGDYKINWASSGLKTVSLSVEENGCTSKTSNHELKVYQPNSSFSLDDVVCENQSTSIDFNGIASDSASFDWDFDSADVLSGTGSGPYELKWKDLGAKIIQLVIDDNGCISDTTVNKIEHNPIPTANFSTTNSICFDNTAVVAYLGNASNNAEFNWNFDGGSIISGIGNGPFEIHWNDSGNKIISLNISDMGCSSDTSFNDVFVKEQTQIMPICMVSVDSSNHNMIIWDNPQNASYDSILIYKESSQSEVYRKIGSLNADNNSVFKDTTSNSAQNSSRYKIAVLDTCGYETPLSSYHKTMHLTINAGIGGSWNLIWDKYEGFDYSTFNIYRASVDGDLIQIAEIASNTFTYSDLSPPVDVVYYQIEVINPNPCVVSTKKIVNSYASSRSNIVSSKEVTAVNKTATSFVEIYPNPAKNQLFINTQDEKNQNVYYLKIINQLGAIMYEQQVNTTMHVIDLTTWSSSGLYCIQVIDYEGKIIEQKKVIFEK